MPDGTEQTPTEINYVTRREVSCDGGIGAYGHPKVYLRIVDRQIACPYCSRLFILKPGAGGDASH